MEMPLSTNSEARNTDQNVELSNCNRRLAQSSIPHLPNADCIPSIVPSDSLASPSCFTPVAMAVQVGTALLAQHTCQLASFQGLKVTSARVQHQQQHQLNSKLSQVSVARRCLLAVRANSPTSAGGASDDAGASTTAKKSKSSSILCQSCDGNGAVACSQCHGAGLNTEDHFNGRFKAGSTCWLCRGKRQMLCGNCNGAGFMGGFMNTQDE